MSLLSRLLGKATDDRAAARPLWNRVVELARDKAWYTTCGVADTVPGRFDALVLVLGLVLVRMEQEEALIPPSVLLSELFIEDMDGQLRQSGVGDLVVGKRIGKLMSALGGRMASLRAALAITPGAERMAALTVLARRNATLIEGGDPAMVAEQLDRLAASLAAASAEDVLAGRFTP